MEKKKVFLKRQIQLQEKVCEPFGNTSVFVQNLHHDVFFLSQPTSNDGENVA